MEEAGFVFDCTVYPIICNFRIGTRYGKRLLESHVADKDSYIDVLASGGHEELLDLHTVNEHSNSSVNHLLTEGTSILHS